jgi:hypothetical protein
MGHKTHLVQVRGYFSTECLPPSQPALNRLLIRSEHKLERALARVAHPVNRIIVPFISMCASMPKGPVSVTGWRIRLQ